MMTLELVFIAQLAYTVIPDTATMRYRERGVVMVT